MTKRFLSGYRSLYLLLAVLPVVSAFAEPLDDGAEALQRGDYATALKLLGPLADDGLPEAQKDLGLMYEK
jgi:TPR repeat protein